MSSNKKNIIVYENVFGAKSNRKSNEKIVKQSIQ